MSRALDVTHVRWTCSIRLVFAMRAKICKNMQHLQDEKNAGASLRKHPWWCITLFRAFVQFSSKLLNIYSMSCGQAGISSIWSQISVPNNKRRVGWIRSLASAYQWITPIHQPLRWAKLRGSIWLSAWLLDHSHVNNAETLVPNCVYASSKQWTKDICEPTTLLPWLASKQRKN